MCPAAPVPRNSFSAGCHRLHLAQRREPEDKNGAQRLIRGASFGPATLKVIGEAFERAWAEIGSDHSTDVEKIAARLRLAQAVLSVAREDSQYPDLLKDEALKAFASA